jgi:transposase
MTRMTEPARHVTGGVDTHADVHVAVVVDSATGQVAGTAAFANSARGHDQLLGWLRGHGHVDKVGVEGTGTYGASLARRLSGHGIEVVEVDRPDRKARRRHGKSDPVDAEAAARGVLAGVATATPKSRDGAVEAMRVLEVLYTSVVKDRTRALNQFTSLLVTAPEEVREPLLALSKAQQLHRARRFREQHGQDAVVRHTRHVLRELACRIAAIETQQAELEARLRPLVAEHAAGLLGVRGVGVHTAAALLISAGDNPRRLRSEAAFAQLCAAAPIPASSGKTTRHRLNRGGDRRANLALWRIALGRMAGDPRTRAYVTRRSAEGKTKNEIVRCLKRYIAREVYHAIVRTPGDLPPPGAALRQLRTQRRLTLQAVADVIHTTPTRLSKLERQLIFDTDLARRAHAYIST